MTTTHVGAPANGQPRERTAWIGLGKMGLPIAQRLQASGFPLTGFDIQAERVEAARAMGMGLAASAPAAASAATLVFTCLPNDAIVIETLCGAGGVIDAMAGGAVLVETSTIGVETSSRIARRAQERGIDYLRAPISGSAVIAGSGRLSCLVSGPREAFERAKPVLQGFSSAQDWLGSDEQARYAKLAMNLMVASTAAMMAEALTLARSGGVAWQDMLSLLDGGVMGSPFVKYRLPNLRERDFAATFSCRQMLKDLDLVLQAAQGSGAPVPVASLVHGCYADLAAGPVADLDFLEIVRHVERGAGLGEPGQGAGT